MTGNFYIPQYLLAEMHSLTLPWLLNQGFTHIVTLAFNRDTTPNGGRKSLKLFHAKLDRLLLGSRWYKKPNNERSFFHAYPEHISSNFHYNMLLRVNAEQIEKVTANIDDIWCSIVESGSTDVKLVSESFDYINLLSYQIKDQRYSNQNFQGFILSTEFLSE